MSTLNSLTAEQFVQKALSSIPKKPTDRLTENVKRVLKKNNYIYDVHVHAFDKKSINEAYFIFQFIREATRRKHFKGFVEEDLSGQELAIEKLLEESGAESVEDFYQHLAEIPDWKKIEEVLLVEDTSEDIEFIKGNLQIDSYPEFVWFVLREFFKAKKQEQLLDFYYSRFALNKAVDQFANKDMIVCLLMMDFHKEFGKRFPKKSLWEQVEEINQLADKKNGHPILPFFAVDARRVKEEGKGNLYNLFLKAFDPKEGGRFFGVKLYPALGVSPSDELLLPIYEVCEKLNIPIVTHCGGEDVSTFSDPIEVHMNFDNSLTVTIEPNENVKGNVRKQRVFNLNDPAMFKPVLERFPKLKLNLAHFGSNEAWGNERDVEEYRKRIKTITEMMKGYDGVFTDFSFCVSDNRTFKKLAEFMKDESKGKLRDRVMYGTDFWVVLFNDREKFKECLRQFDMELLQNKDIAARMLKSAPEAYLYGELYVE